MSFKKKKIPCSTAKNSKVQVIREAYLASRKRNVISAVFLSFIAVLSLVFLASLSFAKVSDFKFDFNLIKNLAPTSLIPNSISEPEKINILLAGVGGGAHDGPQLTDTIILASINTKLKTLSLLSIPRDLYVSYPGGGMGKINELYGRGIRVFGEQKGNKYLEEKITEITGQEIDHFLVVDFAGFKQFVDLLDGLQVNVPEDLVDTEYPNDENWTYTTFSIKKGLQTLDGETALKYVRSRHSTSDFDRSARQQLVMKAAKEKLFQLNYIGNPAKLQALFSTVSEHIKTDMSVGDILSLGLFAKDLKDDHILSFNLNDSCFQSVPLCTR